MDCAVCPITVRKALEKVPGVESVQVDFKTKRAVVALTPARDHAKGLTRPRPTRGSLHLSSRFSDMAELVLQSTLTCPKCGHSKTEVMPQRLPVVLRVRELQGLAASEGTVGLLLLQDAQVPALQTDKPSCGDCC